MDEDAPRPPVYDLLGIEITEAEDGRARGRLPMRPELSAVPGRELAHGGVVAALADSVGYWAVSSLRGFASTPTVDLRMDYLAPAEDDMVATGEVVRNGASVGTVTVDVAAGGERVATARGTFKTGGRSGDWYGDG